MPYCCVIPTAKLQGNMMDISPTSTAPPLPCESHPAQRLSIMAVGISTRNRATMEKSSLFVEVESLCGATGYPPRTPRLEDAMLDVHIRKPITVITETYLGVLRFCRWSQPGHNQKLAHLISEIRVERTHLMFCTNCHKIDITTGYCSWVEIHP